MGIPPAPVQRNGLCSSPWTRGTSYITPCPLSSCLLAHHVRCPCRRHLVQISCPSAQARNGHIVSKSASPEWKSALTSICLHTSSPLTLDIRCPQTTYDKVCIGGISNLVAISISKPQLRNCRIVYVGAGLYPGLLTLEGSLGSSRAYWFSYDFERVRKSNTARRNHEGGRAQCWSQFKWMCSTTRRLVWILVN